jgi:Polyketide cyclase / dehydrase and lipid transport
VGSVGVLLRLYGSVCVDVPVDRVWAALARLEDIVLWSSAVRNAVCPVGRERGVGAERVCELAGGIELVERWTAWDEGRSFTYEGAGVPMLAVARNTWSVEPVGDRTLLVTEAEVIIKGGRVGRVLEPFVKVQSRRMGRRALAALKILIETGDAPDRRFTRGPIPATC